MEYQFAEIEKKWQETWIREKTFEVGNEADRPKFYALIEFPYPSGEGLHMGHPRPYTALDIISRKRRMQGYSVLFPMGWDAFGLPTENYAMRNHIHPAIVTQERTARFKAQMQAIGFSFDWSREINTTDPNYYKWTQWIFLQMFKRGLAYKKEMAVNFCTSCKVVLANEEVVDGNCERCGSEVIRKEKSQWMLAITQYADRLIDDLDSVDYPERVKASQIHWIGRSYGFEVDFRTTQGDVLRVFTTRPDTLFGVTYMVIAPEHPALQLWKNCIENIEAVESYRQLAAKKSDFERTEIAKEKTGVQVQGVYAVNPVNNQKIPIYVSDYVLSSYGTGAIMAVPGHDTRDYEFAKKYGLPIVEVVSGGNIQEEAYTDCEQGIMVHSGMLDGLSVEEAKVKISDWLEKNEKGSRKTNYKLRDWVFARQRYWGEPIPMVHCDKCGYVPLPEEELPLVLPELENYEPTDDGQSPLSRLAHWVKTVCPQCGSPAKRETDTMPQWAGSSWYFLRYCDPKNDKALADRKVLEHWLPVDWYNGGMEHTTLHLLYSRFWYKFLYDIGVVPTKEPYAKRTSHGFILGEDNQKMSKTRGNVINPDDVIAEYGADTLRLYEMFIGDFEKTAPWSTASVRGCKRFLDRVWGLLDMPRTADGTKDMDRLTHRTIKKVSADIEHLKFNTAIAAMMTYTNELYASKCVTDSHLRIFLCLLNPFAPHITEEMWQQLGFSGQVSRQEWPVFEEAKCSEDVVEIVVQVNGKIKTRILVSVFAAEEDVLKQAMEESILAEELKGKSIIKKIYVKSKLINIVAR